MAGGRTRRNTALWLVFGVLMLALYVAAVVNDAGSDIDDTDVIYTPGAEALTIVWIEVQDINPAGHTLEVNVTVVPGAGLVDKSGRLTADLSIGIYPNARLNDIEFSEGREVGTVSALLVTDGDFGNWPFDQYETKALVVDVEQGNGDDRHHIDTRVDITDSLPGWTVTHREATPEPDISHTAYDISLRRANGTLIFNSMLCLVLVALPVMALLVAVTTARDKRPFYPPMTGWFAMMLFAVAPLRNLFPGAPPPGSWIDRSVTVWVLAGLVLAMGLYIYSWWKTGREDK